MTQLRFLATAALALLAGCADVVGPCTIQRATLVPMSLVAAGTRLTVPARLAGHPLELIVDTGASITLLSQTSLAGNNIDYGDFVIKGIGGSRNTKAMQLTRLELGALHGGITAAVTDQVFHAERHWDDGLLGMNVMGAYDVDLDVPGGNLGLYVPRGDCSKPTVALTGALYAVAEKSDALGQIHPRLQVQIDGRNFYAVLDSGAQATVMFREAAQRLGLNAAALAQDRKLLSRGVGTRIEHARLHVFDRIDIGELSLHHVPVAVVDQASNLDTDMLLGMDFIRRVHVWISNSSQTIVMQYPPAPTPGVARSP